MLLELRDTVYGGVQDASDMHSSVPSSGLVVLSIPSWYG